MFLSSYFEISDRTLNGLINKTAASQFFRNLDKVLQLEILKSSYIIMDETYAKAKTNIAKATQKFVKQFYIWVQLSVNLKLVRFSSSGGARNCSIGRGLVESFKGVIQSDAYVFYKNLEKNIFPDIKRVACVQHVKRLYIELVIPFQVPGNY